jgi:hypothetical protein
VYIAVVALLTAIVPTVVLPPTAPFTSQVIVEPAAAQKDAVKDCELPSETLAFAGEMEFVAEHAIVTLALADFELSAILVTVTLTVGRDGGCDGAV